MVAIVDSYLTNSYEQDLAWLRETAKTLNLIEPIAEPGFVSRAAWLDAIEAELNG